MINREPKPAYLPYDKRRLIYIGFLGVTDDATTLFLSFSDLFGGGSCAGFAQNRFIPLNVDYATFHSPKDSEFLELYISFPQKSLQYHRQEEIWVSKFSISLTVKRGNDTVFEQSQPFVNKVETLDNINQFSELRHIFFANCLPEIISPASISRMKTPGFPENMSYR